MLGGGGQVESGGGPPSPLLCSCHRVSGGGGDKGRIGQGENRGGKNRTWISLAVSPGVSRLALASAI